MPIWRWGRTTTPVDAPGHAPLPQPGDTVQIQAQSENGGILSSARVRSVGFRRLFLESDGPITFPLRARLTLTFIAQDALHRFETRLVGPVRGKSLSVARPRRVIRIQRREYYRLPFESPTTFRLLTQDGRRDGTGPVPVRLVNLSGGGALLACSKPLPGGAAVAVRVPSGSDGAPLDVEAEVLDCHVATQGRSRIYLIRLRFFGPPRLDPQDREAIIAHIFHQQRLMLKGRKLLRS